MNILSWHLKHVKSGPGVLHRGLDSKRQSIVHRMPKFQLTLFYHLELVVLTPTPRHKLNDSNEPRRPSLIFGWNNLTLSERRIIYFPTFLFSCFPFFLSCIRNKCRAVYCALVQRLPTLVLYSEEITWIIRERNTSCIFAHLFFFFSFLPASSGTNLNIKR